MSGVTALRPLSRYQAVQRDGGEGPAEEQAPGGDILGDWRWRGFVAGAAIWGVILIGLTLVVQLPIALALAMLLNQPLKGRGVYRLIFFAPYVLSEVTTAVLFTLVFSPNRGLGDGLARWLGADAGTIFADRYRIVSALPARANARGPRFLAERTTDAAPVDL